MSYLPEGAEVDYTASAIVVREGKVLFMNHEKLGQWIQPGGHIEENETPDQGAKREVMEETGFEIKFIDGDQPRNFSEEEDLPTPFNVNIHRIRENHLHCDFIYLAEVSGRKEATHSHEHNGLKWFSREELKSGEIDMPENIRRTVLEGLEKL